MQATRNPNMAPAFSDTTTGKVFNFDGNRALIFSLGSTVPKDALAFCIAAALTYHLRKSKQSNRSGKNGA